MRVVTITHLPGDLSSPAGGPATIASSSASSWFSWNDGRRKHRAAGVPAVAAAVGGVPELIEEGGSGFLVVPYRPDQIADRGVPAMPRTRVGCLDSREP